MNLEEFKKEFERIDNKQRANDEQQKNFFEYMNLLLEWNEKINLTAITEPFEVIKKHFLDSLTILDEIKENESVIDVGTGAGFPGIPLAICSKANFVLVDSLNKRINFLKEVKEKINLNNIEIYHARAEEFAKNKLYREKFDVAVSRAVAPMNILVEYLIPFVKVGGKIVCMKGPKAEEELEEAKKAIEILGGKVEQIKEFNLGEEQISRKIIIIKKIKNTPNKYPRRPGTPAKEPIK